MRFRGLVYRAHNPQWSWTPLSGEGACRHGGRFDRCGMPALYTPLTLPTAIREAQPLGRPMQPLTLCTYEVDAEPVFDALNGRQRKALGVSHSDSACPAWEAEMLAGKIPSSQALADRLIAEGYAGMRVRSFAAGTDVEDVNLVLWTWGVDRPVRVIPIDDEGRLSGDRTCRSEVAPIHSPPDESGSVLVDSSPVNAPEGGERVMNVVADAPKVKEANANVTLVELDTGHNVGGEDPDGLVRAVKEFL